MGLKFWLGGIYLTSISVMKMASSTGPRSSTAIPQLTTFSSASTDSSTPDSILSYAARNSLSSPSTNNNPGGMAYPSPSSSHPESLSVSSAYSPYSSAMVANYYYDQIIKSERLSPHSHQSSQQGHIVLASSQHESPHHQQDNESRPSVVSIIS